MEIFVAFVIIIAFLGTMYPIRDVPQGTLEIFPNTTKVQQFSVKHDIKPFSEFKDRNIVKQEFDYSCGSAALATLLNYYLGEKLSEQQVIQGLMQYGEVEKIQQRRAFSLLDMKRFVEVLGYDGAGYNADFEDIRSLDKPAIVPIDISGYKHFVIFRGVYGDHVFLADPYLGNTSYTIKKFKEMWSQKIVFIISKENIRFNAMELSSEDLRIINYDITKHAFTQSLPPDLVTQRMNFIESLGGTYFKTVNTK